MIVTMKKGAGEDLGLGVDAELRINKVEEGKAAKRAGVKKGWMVLSVGRLQVNNESEMRNAMQLQGNVVVIGFDIAAVSALPDDEARSWAQEQRKKRVEKERQEAKQRSKEEREQREAERRRAEREQQQRRRREEERRQEERRQEERRHREEEHRRREEERRRREQERRQQEEEEERRRASVRRQRTERSEWNVQQLPVEQRRGMEALQRRWREEARRHGGAGRERSRDRDRPPVGAAAAAAGPGGNMTMAGLFRAADAMDYIDKAWEAELEVETIAIASTDMLQSVGLPLGAALRLHRALGEKSRYYGQWR
jgi:hypothetical protein